MPATGTPDIPGDPLREVGLDYSLSGLVDVGELEELGLLLVEQVGEVLHAVLELGVELGSVVALEVVRDDNCSLVLLWLALRLHCVREEIHLRGHMEGFLALGLWDLRGLIVLREDGFLSNFTELLVEVETLLVVRLAISCIVDCVNRGDQLRGATEFVLNKLLFGLLYTQASHVFSEAPHGRAFVRAEDGCVIIGRINSLDFDGFVAEIFKLEGQLLFNCFGVFILLANCLGKSFGVLGGTLG